MKNQKIKGLSKTLFLMPLLSFKSRFEIFLIKSGELKGAQEVGVKEGVFETIFTDQCSEECKQAVEKATEEITNGKIDFKQYFSE